MAQGVVSLSGSLESKPWGTKEFGLYDPNGAAIVFYELLEKENPAKGSD